MNRLVPALPVLLFSAVSVSAQTSSLNPPSHSKAEDSSVSGTVVRLAGGEPLKGAGEQLKDLENAAQTPSTATVAGGGFGRKEMNPAGNGPAASRMGFV